jgi:hypothetical protein
MQPLILLLIALGQTGCLFAPSRPGGGGSSGDAGGDAGGNDCVPADTRLGVSVAAALERPDRDTLVRAAHAAGSWYLYFYPSTTRTSRCPEQMLQLGKDIESIDAIQPAIVTGTNADLLVLASFTNGDSAVIDVRSVGGAISEVGRVVATGYRPIPIGTSSGPDPTGFVALRGNELLFGGGLQGIAFADVGAGISGAAKKLTALPILEGWYQAIGARNPHGTMNFMLLGALASYEAVVGVSMIDTTLVVDYGLCTTPPGCQARMASIVTSPGPVDTAEGFTVDRTNGSLITIASASGGFMIGSHAPNATGPGGVLDAAIGELAGDNKTDVAMLWGSGSGSRQLIVYDGFLTNTMGNVVSQHTIDTLVNRVEILRTGDKDHILVLSDDPRAEAEQCLQLDVAALVDCP